MAIYSVIRVLNNARQIIKMEHFYTRAWRTGYARADHARSIISARCHTHTHHTSQFTYSIRGDVTNGWIGREGGERERKKFLPGVLANRRYCIVGGNKRPRREGRTGVGRKIWRHADDVTSVPSWQTGVVLYITCRMINIGDASQHRWENRLSFLASYFVSRTDLIGWPKNMLGN
jgi:hypothetical protein